MKINRFGLAKKIVTMTTSMKSSTCFLDDKLFTVSAPTNLLNDCIYVSLWWK